MMHHQFEARIGGEGDGKRGWKLSVGVGVHVDVGKASVGTLPFFPRSQHTEHRSGVMTDKSASLLLLSRVCV